MPAACLGSGFTTAITHSRRRRGAVYTAASANALEICLVGLLVGGNRRRFQKALTIF